jgi:hypothetical protein
MEQKNTVMTQDSISDSHNGIIRSSFSGLFFQGPSFNSYWSLAENEVLMS